MSKGLRQSPQHWDIFCRVVDNFGDLGVCWRLARQLASERGLRVRLWLDNPAPLSLIAPQRDDAVEISPWPNGAEMPEIADIVIEAFACELPAPYLQGMAATSAVNKESAPCWINLEYLSAEEWIEDCHGLASPHPRLQLVKYFFFPGFTPASGGLLRESDIFVRQRCRAEFLASLGIEDQPDALLLSLFCYENAPLAALIKAWEQTSSLRPILCLVPPGQPCNALYARLGKPSGWRVGNVRLLPIPFLPQEAYDTLLFVSDFNFARGEDSFVRAQWAGKPFVWQAYPQTENAHHAKLAAFAERYRPRPLLLDFWRSWNGADFDENAIHRFWSWLRDDHAALDELTIHAQKWRTYLASEEDMTTRLIRFCSEKQRLTLKNDSLHDCV
ncbi:MAG: elongation factor P maturation arginine rhamnosyltransferase EarP [Betaproteobacteria bacterium]|nr:elongation factor P maturation arginine rhamnosyltransferase EarP [Betaproteobacteria bacterium]